MGQLINRHSLVVRVNLPSSTSMQAIGDKFINFLPQITFLGRPTNQPTNSSTSEYYTKRRPKVQWCRVARSLLGGNQLAL